MGGTLEAVPQTLNEWRAFVAYERHPLTLLSHSERDALSATGRASYDDARLRIVNEPMVLRTPQISEIQARLRVCVGMSAGPQFTARHGLALSGSQRLGKSTASMYLGREHERVRRAALGREKDKDFAPVLYVSTPPESSPKQLMSAFARTLGLPVGSRVSTDVLMDQVIKVMTDLGTSLVILDEVQNLTTRASAGMAAANALKAFSERLPAVFMYVGVRLEDSDFLAGPMRDQINGRLTFLRMEPHHYGTEEARELWDRLVMQFEECFPLAEHEVGSLAAANDWLFSATRGVIGSLRTILRAAQVSAIFDDVEYVDVARVKNAITDYRSQQNLEAALLAAPTKSKRANGAKRPQHPGRAVA